MDLQKLFKSQNEEFVQNVHWDQFSQVDQNASTVTDCTDVKVILKASVVVDHVLRDEANQFHTTSLHRFDPKTVIPSELLSAAKAVAVPVIRARVLRYSVYNSLSVCTVEVSAEKRDLCSNAEIVSIAHLPGPPDDAKTNSVCGPINGVVIPFGMHIPSTGGNIVIRAVSPVDDNFNKETGPSFIYKRGSEQPMSVIDIKLTQHRFNPQPYPQEQHLMVSYEFWFVFK